MDCHHWAEIGNICGSYCFSLQKNLEHSLIGSNTNPFWSTGFFRINNSDQRQKIQEPNSYRLLLYGLISAKATMSVLKILLTYLKNTYLLPWCPLWWFDDLIDVIVVLDDIKITCSDDFGSDQSSRDQFKNMIQYLNWYMTGDTFWVNTWDIIWALTRDLIQDMPTKKCTIWICKERMKIWADFRGF